eukprot:13972620-Alexandrium_andersonii.AAC.1
MTFQGYRARPPSSVPSAGVTSTSGPGSAARATPAPSAGWGSSAPSICLSGAQPFGEPSGPSACRLP